MKKLLLSILLATVFASLSAQDINHTDMTVMRHKKIVWAGGGVLAQPPMNSDHSAAMTGISINAGVAVEASKSFYVGASLSYTFDKYRYPEYNDMYLSPMAYLKYNWLDTKYFAMYFQFSLGIMINANDAWSTKPSLSPAWHLSPIGLEAGYKQVWFYAELGVGNEGVLNAGLRFKF